MFNGIKETSLDFASSRDMTSNRTNFPKSCADLPSPEGHIINYVSHEGKNAYLENHVCPVPPTCHCKDNTDPGNNPSEPSRF